MKDTMSTVENYNGVDIKYIPFADWYVVFRAKKNGTSEMHHFPTSNDAKKYIDEDMPKTNFWWMKEE